MAKDVEKARDDAPPALFNSALETGVRALIVLDAVYPRAFDIARLTWCDHLVVHTADIGGPDILHPDIPQRTGELLVRRRLVEDGVALMRRLHMIDTNIGDHGIQFQASEEAPSFVEMLRSDYSVALKARAQWLASYLAEKSDDALTDLIVERIGRWAIEFQGEAGRSGS
jgi:hypothetical protein